MGLRRAAARLHKQEQSDKIIASLHRAVLIFEGHTMHFLHQIRLANKFLLLGCIALLMVALPTGLYFQNAWGSAAFARQEASGRDAVVALNRTIQTLQSHRGLAAGALGGNE